VGPLYREGPAAWVPGPFLMLDLPGGCGRRSKTQRSQNSVRKALSDSEILSNQSSILKNQKEILENQETIKKNQKALDEILANQKEILKNQNEILANQKEILGAVKK
jgi:hypothetical protein